MTNSQIFTIGITLLATGCANFSPDLNGLGTDGDESLSDGSSGDGSSGDDTTDSATSTSGPGSGEEADTGDESSGDGSSGEDSSGDGAHSSDGGGTCGNNVVDDDEECDGANVLGATCEEADYHGGGSVGCSEDCILDYEGCQDLVYEQRFSSPEMPDEIELLGSAFPLLQDFTGSYPGEGQWNGGCFTGPDDWCMQTGAIAHEQITGFRITLDFAAPGTVSFWVVRWTESWDLFEFYIDDEVVESSGGMNLAFEEWTHQIETSGTHELMWLYRKNNSITEGFDTVWIDEITATNAEAP